MKFIYHAMLRNELLDLLHGPKEARETSFEDLTKAVQETRARISWDGYQEHLEEDRYVELVRKTTIKRYCFHNGPALIPSRRLFLIEASPDDPPYLLFQTAEKVAEYTPFTRNGYNGPLPMLCIRGTSPNQFSEFKRILFDELYQHKAHFLDATSASDLELHLRMATRDLRLTRPRIQLVDEVVAAHPDVLRDVRQIFEFYRTAPSLFPTSSAVHPRIQASSTQQILLMLRFK